MKTVTQMTANILYDLINSEERAVLEQIFIEKTRENRFAIESNLGFGKPKTYPLTVGYCKFVLKELRRGRSFCSTPSYM